MQERDVIRATRTFLYAHGLYGFPVRDLFTDAHPTLLPDTELRPFQRFTLAFDGFSAHPDLVGRLVDGETTFAIEAKGKDDLLAGIAQADLYRNGFHLALFACAGQPPRDLLNLARQRGVGVLAVFPQRAELIDLPPLHLPQLRHASHIQRQFVATDTLRQQFLFNLPTHYLCFVTVLLAWAHEQQRAEAALPALEPFTRLHYPVLPQGSQSFRAALSGSAKLGLVQIQGNTVRLTFLGHSIADLLPDTSTLTQIHRQLAQRGSAAQTLAALHGSAAAALRCLLYQDPVARFIIDTLWSARRHEPLTMRELVVLGAEVDKMLTSAVFFHPEAIAQITDDQGLFVWRRIEAHHFRSTTFMQYKSILKHAGIIKPHRLGGSSAKHYDPDQDLWELL